MGAIQTLTDGSEIDSLSLLADLKYSNDQLFKEWILDTGTRPWQCATSLTGMAAFPAPMPQPPRRALMFRETTP